ncbi:MAG: ABC transporter permease [Acidobacteriota bacterium]|nr:ABC transporter permease [Acidobacteriota bacterium]
MIEQTAIQENLSIATKNKKPFESLTKITVIARNAFREAVRDRVLYNLVLFVLLITAAAIFLGELTAGQEARVITNLGLTAMLLFGAFISIFVGIGLVSKEIEKRTVFAIFAKPVGRGEFLVGKYLGLCLTLAVNVLVMGVGLSLALFYVGDASLAASAWSAVFLIFLELTILTAVAILFSSFSSPALSALLTFFVFIIGHSSSALKDMADSLGTASAQFFFNALYYILPNLAYFNFVTAAANGKTPSANHIFGAVAYAAVYVSILLAASVLIFSRRNFK